MKSYQCEALACYRAVHSTQEQLHSITVILLPFALLHEASREVSGPVFGVPGMVYTIFVAHTIIHDASFIPAMPHRVFGLLVRLQVQI